MSRISPSFSGGFDCAAANPALNTNANASAPATNFLMISSFGQRPSLRGMSAQARTDIRRMTSRPTELWAGIDNLTSPRRRGLSLGEWFRLDMREGAARALRFPSVLKKGRFLREQPVMSARPHEVRRNHFSKLILDYRLSKGICDSAEIKNYAVRPEGANDQPEPHVHFRKLICSITR